MGNPAWGTSTITRSLNNEAYIGTGYYNRGESLEGNGPRGARNRKTRNWGRPREESIATPPPTTSGRSPKNAPTASAAPKSATSSADTKEAHEIDRALTTLVDAGRLQRTRGHDRTTGRPTEIWIPHTDHLTARPLVVLVVHHQRVNPTVRSPTSITYEDVNPPHHGHSHVACP
jgi:hypothetical protein